MSERERELQLLGEAQNDSIQRGQESIVKEAAVLDGDLKILLVVL